MTHVEFILPVADFTRFTFSARKKAAGNSFGPVIPETRANLPKIESKKKTQERLIIRLLF